MAEQLYYTLFIAKFQHLPASSKIHWNTWQYIMNIRSDWEESLLFTYKINALCNFNCQTEKFKFQADLFLIVFNQIIHLFVTRLNFHLKVHIQIAFVLVYFYFYYYYYYYCCCCCCCCIKHFSILSLLISKLRYWKYIWSYPEKATVSKHSFS